MDARTLATAHAAGRVAIGSALTVLPRLAAGAWVGGSEAGRPATGVLGPAMGARDLAIGLGTLAALLGGGSARPWILAGAAGDLTDLVVTLRERERLPFLGAAGVTALAAVSTAIGLYGAASLE